MTILEDRYYDPPEPLTDEDRITDTCVYECRGDRGPECGMQLPDTAGPTALFCGYHDAAVYRGDITWEEYTDYQRRYGA